jgi:hypothetical protein
MLKILLVIGGVWFSFAFVFVLALAAGAKKSIPPETAASESVATTAAPIVPEIASVLEARASRPPQRRPRWRVGKPVRA